MSKKKKKQKAKLAKKKLALTRKKCKHDYGYCYFSRKDHVNIYRCVLCGHWLYC